MSPKKTSVFQNINSQPLMLTTIVFLWIISNVFFLKKYYLFITAQSIWFSKIYAIIVISWILLTSFYAYFHFVSFFFSFHVRKFSKNIPRDYTYTPPVAILYTCMNDSKEKAIRACLGQQYPNFSVFVLDDSSSIKEQQLVNKIHLESKHGFRLIRRSHHSGYKAGNLNNILFQIGKRFTYICVIDSDEIIPNTFLRDLVSILEQNKDLGYVQASHRQYSETDFSKSIDNDVNLHWNYFFPARNIFGFIYSYGHGVLFRSQALLEIGGFPEIASEDIAVSCLLREKGYKGFFAYDVESKEEIPPSLQAFRRKNKKIVAGTLEFFSKYFWQFCRSTKIPLVEKIDFGITLFVIFLPVLFLLYVVLSYVLFFSKITLNMISTFNNFSFLFFLFFTIFAPFVYLLPSIFKTPVKGLLHIFRLGTINLSTCVQTTGVVFKWIFYRSTGFIPTGDRTIINSDVSLVFETILGVGCLIAGFFAKSLFLIAIGLSFTFVFFIGKRICQRRILRILLPLPIIITIIALFFTPISLVFATSAIVTGTVWVYY
jgi:cellulose synthase/poly-beta-1,6-N-acetylglucosamine synthase-like glycosyltransferase